jgi:hypothetical protein
VCERFDGTRDGDLLAADDHPADEEPEIAAQALGRCGAYGLAQRCAYAVEFLRRHGSDGSVPGSLGRGNLLMQPHAIGLQRGQPVAHQGVIQVEGAGFDGVQQASQPSLGLGQLPPQAREVPIAVTRGGR